VDKKVRFEERLAALRDSFVGALPARLAGLRAAVAAGDREAVQLEAHRLAGTGTSYGLPELSAWGRSVEQLCRLSPAALERELAQALDDLAQLIAGVSQARLAG
jgi:HPt (histidine-containing phosphotransfer) domain-containing protein